MGFRRPDVNRMLNRLNEGFSSMRATEAVLEFIYQKQCSLDKVLTGYADNCHGVSDEAVRMACKDMARILREQMAIGYRAAGMKMRILQSAEVFMGQLEHAFCSDHCRMRQDCETDCACRKFAEFVAWMQEKIEVDSAETAI